MSDKGKNIVPFGKYKGQDVAVMAADQGYCEWLRNQPWFAEKFRDVYNIVINYGAEPQDTPEHNALQARFLDEAFCMAVVRASIPEFVDFELIMETETKEFEDREITRNDPVTFKSVIFEVDGWDVVIKLGGGCRVHAVNGGYKEWFYGPTAFDHYAREPSCSFFVECKTAIGDDYPSILRQVKSFRNFFEWRDGHSMRRQILGPRVILVDQFSSLSVTLDQVRRIFDNSGIRLVMLDEVLAKMAEG